MTAKELGQQPAHPTAYMENNGLTKREAFAMAALQGMLANSADGGFATASLPRFAVDMADRMLDELAKEAA